jgi:WD40 repeat protein
LSARGSLIALLAGGALALGLPAHSGAAGPPAKERLDPYGDPLPAGAIMRLGTQRWRHRDGFIDPVLSPDGRWVLSTSRFGDGINVSGLNIWDWSSGRVVRTLHPNVFDPWPFSLYTFFPDGKRLLSQGNGELSIWEFPSFRLLKRWRVGHWRSLVLSPDGRFAAGAAGEGIKPQEVHAFNLQTGSARPIWKTASGYAEAVALTGDGSIVVVHAPTVPRLGDVSDRTHFILRIDLLTRRVCSRFAVQAEETVLAPDGRNLVASSWNRGLRLYRVDTARMRRLPLTAGKGMAYDVKFRRDGRVLVTVDFPLPNYRSDGSREPVDSGPRLAWTWDVDRGELLRRIRVPDRVLDGSLNDSILSPDGRAILFFGNSAATRVSLRTGNLMDDRAAFNQPINCLRWCADGRELVAETWYEQQVKWNAVTGRVLGRVQRRDFGILQRHTFRAQSPDGSWLALGSGNSIELFDVWANKVKHKLDGHEHDLSSSFADFGAVDPTN